LPGLAPAQILTEYTIPTANGPRGIVAGPDGALWFTEGVGNRIARITAAGVITEFAIPTSDSDPYGITSGPDGALWFTEQQGNRIGRITTTGTITEFAIPTADSYPHGITSGPDGALWFTEFSSSKIGRISTAGVVTEFALLTSLGPYGIVAGLDGALWFTQPGCCNGRYGGYIGKITTAGTVTFESQTLGQPAEISAGPDGALWFTENTYTVYGAFGKTAGSRRQGFSRTSSRFPRPTATLTASRRAQTAPFGSPR